MTELLCGNETHRILGACFEVYKEKGCGFVEPVYQECLEIEFEAQHVPFVPQSEVRIVYKQTRLRQTYRPDFVCYEKVIVELKAVTALRMSTESRSSTTCAQRAFASACS